MYGVNLFRLARLVGVKKIDIARHLGVVKVMPTLWSQGKRPIPDGTVEPLVAFIAQAVKKRLAYAHRWDTIRADLTAALRDVFAENCQRYGHAPVATLEAFMTEFEKYVALSQPQQHQGARLEHMERVSAAMLCWFELQQTLQPLLRLLPEEETATVEERGEKTRKVHR